MTTNQKGFFKKLKKLCEGSGVLISEETIFNFYEDDLIISRVFVKGHQFERSKKTQILTLTDTQLQVF